MTRGQTTKGHSGAGVGGGVGRAPPEIIDRIVEMTERGKSRGTIARVLGVSRATVDYHRLNAGLLCEKSLRVGPLCDYVRHGIAIRRYTPSEDERLSNLRIAGYSLSRIGAEMGRAPSSVFMRLKTLARRQEAA